MQIQKSRADQDDHESSGFTLRAVSSSSWKGDAEGCRSYQESATGGPRKKSRGLQAPGRFLQGQNGGSDFKRQVLEVEKHPRFTRAREAHRARFVIDPDFCTKNQGKNLAPWEPDDTHRSQFDSNRPLNDSNQKIRCLCDLCERKGNFPYFCNSGSIFS